jgi:hypothetical protein
MVDIGVSEWQTSKSLTTTRGGGFAGILSLRESVCLTLHPGCARRACGPVHSSPTRGGGFLEME